MEKNEHKYITLVNLMLAKQNSLNVLTVGEDWTTRNLEWYRAIYMEAAEAVESIGYKWWKKKDDINLDNYAVELIDIVHFTLAWAYEKHGAQFVNNVDTTDFQSKYTYNTIIDDIIKQAHLGGNPNTILTLAIEGLELLNYTVEDVFKMYMTKNVLNEFRQNNGYKDGSYKKMWNGEEDNVHTFEVAKGITADENFADTLMAELDSFYKTL